MIAGVAVRRSAWNHPPRNSMRRKDPFWNAALTITVYAISTRSRAGPAVRQHPAPLLQVARPDSATAAFIFMPCTIRSRGWRVRRASQGVDGASPVSHRNWPTTHPAAAQALMRFPAGLPFSGGGPERSPESINWVSFLAPRDFVLEMFHSPAMAPASPQDINHVLFIAYHPSPDL